jgi:hypothetical protein
MLQRLAGVIRVQDALEQKRQPGKFAQNPRSSPVSNGRE